MKIFLCHMQECMSAHALDLPNAGRTPNAGTLAGDRNVHHGSRWKIKHGGQMLEAHMPVHLQMEAWAQQWARLRERLCLMEAGHERMYSLWQTSLQVWHAYLIARCQHRDQFGSGVLP